MPQPISASALRIALIDDDSGLMTVLERRFAAKRWDHQVIGYAADPEQLTALKIHALIINPAITGLGYIEWVADRVPGLAMLVCSRPAPVADRVRALRTGADDWITKPCHPEELVARIEAVLRRRRAGELPAQSDTVVAGELSIRPDRFDAYVRDNPAALSRKEYELLVQLATADGRVLQREEIYQRVWGYTMARGDRSVDVFVRKLRQKLELVSPGWRYVHTHFGVGYRFAAEPVGSGPATPAGSRPVETVGSPPADGAHTRSVEPDQARSGEPVESRSGEPVESRPVEVAESRSVPVSRLGSERRTLTV
jgi:DNA-binding response OmpR family regulator